MLLMLVNISACSSFAGSQRYRGDYTLGHEVNTFCPEINSQCYWLSPDTNRQVREQLKQVYREKSLGLYQPVCLIVSGEIDRKSTRTGFAADMDGLFTVYDVFGECDAGSMVTQGDLQHHRWVLVSLDNKPINMNDWPVLPVLDFGEHMFVEGGDGCRRFNGFAKLAGDNILFDKFEFNQPECETDQYPQSLFSIAGNWRISIEQSRYLFLENTSSTLMFRLDDWR